MNVVAQHRVAAFEEIWPMKMRDHFMIYQVYGVDQLAPSKIGVYCPYTAPMLVFVTIPQGP